MQNLFSDNSSARQPAQVAWERAGILALVLFVAVGIIYSAILPNTPRFTDENDYFKLSHNVAYGPGFSMDGVKLTATRPPGYAYFLAALRVIGGDYFIFRAIQFLLLGATLFAVSRLVSERPASGALALVVGLVLCYPVIFFTCGTLYPQTLAGFLFVVGLWLLLAAPGRIGLNLLGGAVFGLLILTVPTFLFTLVVVLVTARWLQIMRGRDVLVTLLAAGLVVNTWTVRNAVCFDRFVPIATNSGLNFLEGNNENATPEAAANVGMQPYYDEADRLGLDEFQRDRFYRESALLWIEIHPRRATILYFEKAANFFNVINVYSSESQTQVSMGRQVVLAAGYLLLLSLLAWRLCGLKRFPLLPREKLFLAVYVLSAFTSALFFTRIRLRLPYDYLIIAVVAHYISRRIEARLTG